MKRTTVKFFQTPSGRTYAYEALSNRIISVELADEGAVLNNELCETLYEKLKAQGFIESDTFESVEWRKSFQEYKLIADRKCPELLLEVTKKCNLKCDYCVVSGAACSLMKKDDMTEDTLIKAIDFFIGCNRENDSASIDFYGGEALIRFDLIKKAVEYAKEKIKDKSLTFGISTNGMLLNTKVAEWLSQNPEVRVTCTVNGPYHDLYRKTLSGNGSLDTIMNNLTFIKVSYPEVWENQLRFIANVDDESEIIPMLEFYRNNIGKRPGIITMIDWPKGTSGAFEKKADAFGFYSKIDFSKDRFIADFYKQRFWRVQYRSVKLGVIKGFVGSCFPGQVRLFVQCNGNIGFCEKASNAAVIGNVNSGTDESILRKIYYDTRNLYNIKCTHCWAQRLCESCIARIIDSQGNVMESIPESFCTQMKQKIITDLILYCQMAEQAPELLLKNEEDNSQAC